MIYQITKLIKKNKILTIAVYRSLILLKDIFIGDKITDINIETSTLCNKRCSYCPNAIYDRGLKQQLMPKKVFNKIINELKEMGFKGGLRLHFFNEPLLDDRIIDLIKYAKYNLPNSYIKIHTNGDYLFAVTRNDLMENGADEVFVNVIDNDTPLQNRGGLIKVKHQSPIPRCFSPTSPVVVTYNGDVVLCCNDYHSSVIFGNVKYQKLIDIWNTQKFTEVRKELKRRRYRFKICLRCIGK